MKEQMTKTEQAIFDLLMDGKGHKRRDIHKAVCGPSSLITVNVHISNLRKKLPAGLEIVSVASKNGLVYRIFRTIASAQEG